MYIYENTTNCETREVNLQNFHEIILDYRGKWTK